MIRINTNKILLCLLILSCIINGIIFEGIFFLSLEILIYRNRNAIARNKQYKLFIMIVLLYIALLLLTLFYFKTTKSWRPVGITKVLCGISFCVLFSDRLCETDVEKVFISFLVLFNLLFVAFGIPSESGIEILELLDYPGQNTLGALNMIALPHIIRTYKGKIRMLRSMFLVTFIMFFFKNLGFTSIFSTGIVAAWILINYLKEKIYIKRYRLNRQKFIIVPSAIAVLILLFFTNSNIQKYYLDLLLKTDMDRYTILSQAIYRISTATPHDLVWGTGDNNFYMLTGRYIVAHNFIIETITFDGLIGFVVLIFETFVFIRFMLMKMSRLPDKGAIMLSIIIGYLFFLLHPVYTTSFLVKLFLVVLNLRVCNSSAESDFAISIGGSL